MIVSHRFQVLFHSAHRSSFHLSLTVLVRYRSGSSIQDWRVVPPASVKITRVPTYSGSCQLSVNFKYGTITLYGRAFQLILLSTRNAVCSPQPRMQAFGLSYIPFRSPLLWESRLIYFPSGTEMFHFPEFAPRRVLYLSIQWVAPFGNPRIKAFWQLPEAYRSLIRPSSPLPAKASTYGP